MHWSSWMIGFWDGVGAFATARVLWLAIQHYRRHRMTLKLLRRCDEYVKQRQALRRVSG